MRLLRSRRAARLEQAGAHDRTGGVMIAKASLQDSNVGRVKGGWCDLRS